MQHPEPHDITALAYGLIEGTERETLLTHVSECDACRAVYDSYREEQAGVRNSIMHDARSGAAEAKALESTLKMLGGFEEAKPRGRLLGLPRWVLVAEVAAMLAVAVGLFFILKPDNEPEVVPIAEELRAPAKVDGGVVYVSDRQGEWKPADGVPEDEWVMAGSEGPLLLTMENGSQAKIEPSGVFRVGRDGVSRQLMVQILRGNGVIDTADMTENMFVRSGDAGFYAMPQARFSISSETDDAKWRSWTQATRVHATVNSGDVVLWPEGRQYNKLPLQSGDKVEWTAQDFKVYTHNGKTLPMKYWHAAANPQLIETEFDSGEVQRMMIELKPRLADLQKRLDNMPHGGDLRADELRKQLFFLGGAEDIEIFVRATTIHDVVTITLVENQVTRTVKVSTDGERVNVTVNSNGTHSEFKAGSPDKLKAADTVPAFVRELLDCVEFEQDAEGHHRIRGAEVESKPGVQVKVVSSSSSGD